MNLSEIDVGETHIRLATDLDDVMLKEYILKIRRDLQAFILNNQDFRYSIEPIDFDVEEEPLIVKKMVESSLLADVGPMACVAGTISQLSLEYLMENSSRYSIVENGGDIAMVNNKKVLCGIYSNNDVLGNNIAFEIRPRKKALGICTSSGKIGHSISFGDSDSVTVISESSSLADGLATRIANSVHGEDSEQKVNNAIECGEEYGEFFDGVLIISGGHVGTIGKLPKIVETNNFNIKL